MPLSISPEVQAQSPGAAPRQQLNKALYQRVVRIGVRFEQDGEGVVLRALQP